jgi:hypothetical protein
MANSTNKLSDEPETRTKSTPGSSKSRHDERPSLPAFEMVDVVRMVDNDSTLPETTWQVITYRLRGLSQF